MNATPVHLSTMPFGPTSAHQSFHLCNALKSVMKKVHSVWLSCFNQVLRAAKCVCNKIKHPFAHSINQGPAPAKPALPPTPRGAVRGAIQKVPLIPPALAPAPAVQKAALIAPAVLPAAPRVPHVVRFAPLPTTPKLPPQASAPKGAALLAPAVRNEPAFAQICMQALREAEGKVINSVVEFEGNYIDLFRKITRTAQELQKGEEPACNLQRYKTLASYLHFASERANSDEMRDKVAILLENLQQKYANRHLAVPADQEALFEQIRNRIVVRRATDPVSIPLPGDEMPEDEANVRSIRMRTWLDAMFSHQNYCNGKFYLGNQEHELVTSEVSNFTGRRLASIGSSKTREIVTLDPNHCPKLSAFYQQLEQEVIRKSAEKGGLLSPEMILLLVKDCVRNKIFPSCSQAGLMKKLDQFLADRRLTQPSVPLAIGGSVPVFSIEDFIGGPAVCRHHGLVASYLLDRLVKSQGGKTVPTGRVMHMRSNLDNRGAHVWVNFICSNGKKYHLDTLWDAMVQFDHPESRPLLNMMYGQKAMRLQELRCKKAANELQKSAVPLLPAAAAA
ncbi:MAG: hypothetical protein LLG04_16085 [Parachlamydia sp.]|nr:hypothetical protein [Parachlamydia sp.]